MDVSPPGTNPSLTLIITNSIYLRLNLCLGSAAFPSTIHVLEPTSLEPAESTQHYVPETDYSSLGPAATGFRQVVLMSYDTTTP